MKQRHILVQTLACVVATLANSVGTAAASGALYGVIYDTGAAVEKLVSIDPTTGALTPVGAGLAGCCYVSSGVSTYDPVNDSFYFVGHYMADASGVDRIFRVDASTGVVTSDAILPSGYNYNFLEYDHVDGALFAVIHDTAGILEKLVTIDSSTGSLTDVGAGVGACCMVPSGLSTLDPVSDRFYFIGHYMAESGVYRIFAMDTTTGAVASEPTLPSGNNYNFLELDHATATLYAMIYDTSVLVEKLAAVDPSTGTLTPVGAGISGCCMVPSGVSTFDPDDGKLYFIGHYMADSGFYRIFAIDAATGLVASDAVLPTGYNYNFLEYDMALNQPPVALCQDVTVTADQSCTADASIDAGSHDPDGDPITLSQTPPGPYSLGDTLVTLLVEDDHGASDTCQATATVELAAVLEIACNAPPTIVPPDAPVSFAATAAGGCGSATAAITGYDCYKYTRHGRRVDKTDSCAVEVEGDTVTILDSGGVGDNIDWFVTASDNSTTITGTCHVEVVNPGRGNGPG